MADEKSSFIEIALIKLRRALSEPSEDVKLIFLLSGIEALYNSQNDRMKIPDIIRIYNERLSEKAENIIGQSYWRRNQILHGKLSDFGHISKLVPKLQQILHILIIHQLNLGFSPEFSDIKLDMDQEAVVL
jgi:protoheme ferro-lyase